MADVVIKQTKWNKCPSFPVFPTSPVTIWQMHTVNKHHLAETLWSTNILLSTMEWRGELYILIPRLLLWVPHSRRLILDSRFWILSLRLIWQMQWTSTTCLKAQCQIIKLSCARTTFLQMRPNVVKLCRVCATLFYTNSSPMLPTIFATLNETQLLVLDMCIRKTILFKVME